MLGEIMLHDAGSLYIRHCPPNLRFVPDLSL